MDFKDDNDNVVQTATAEGHALNNPGHVVTVVYDKDKGALGLECVYPECHWWEEKLYT